jgi:hypothetical protein
MVESNASWRNRLAMGAGPPRRYGQPRRYSQRKAGWSRPVTAAMTLS